MLILHTTQPAINWKWRLDGRGEASKGRKSSLYFPDVALRSLRHGQVSNGRYIRERKVRLGDFLHAIFSSSFALL